MTIPSFESSSFASLIASQNHQSSRTASLSPANSRQGRSRPRQHDLLLRVVLLGVVMMTSLTVHTLPHVQRLLDSTVTNSDPWTRNSYTVPHRPSPNNKGPKTTLKSTTTMLSNNDNHSNRCLSHAPLATHSYKLSPSSNKDNTKGTNNGTILQQPSPEYCGRLRRKWWNHPQQTLSPVAREIQVWQTNCSLPPAALHLDNSFGFGSHLYLWSQALCNVMETGHRMQTYNPDWLWKDKAYCSPVSTGSPRDDEDPFTCYFPHVYAPTCNSNSQSYQDTSHHKQAASRSLHTRPIAPKINVTEPRNPRRRCQRLRHNETALQEFRSATIEYFFQQLSPLVLQEARRQAGLLFPNGVAPPDLITVHLRWGDKFWEMDLAPIDEYIEAVQQLLNNKSNKDASSNKTAHIYLATEDPRASQEFLAAAPSHWQIYLDRTLVELTSVRPTKGNRASWMAKNTAGRAGLMNLASWIIALEAADFVLTTASNWSRVVNELRRLWLPKSSRMIDLRPGSW